MGVWVPPAVAEEKFKCITNGVDGAYSMIVGAVNDEVEFSSSM